MKKRLFLFHFAKLSQCYWFFDNKSSLVFFFFFHVKVCGTKCMMAVLSHSGHFYASSQDLCIHPTVQFRWPSLHSKHLNIVPEYTDTQQVLRELSLITSGWKNSFQKVPFSTLHSPVLLSYILIFISSSLFLNFSSPGSFQFSSVQSLSSLLIRLCGRCERGYESEQSILGGAGSEGIWQVKDGRI